MQKKINYSEVKCPRNVPVLLEHYTSTPRGVNHGVIKPTEFIPMEKRSKDFGILKGFHKPSSSFIDFCCHLEQSNGEKFVHCRWRALQIAVHSNTQFALKCTHSTQTGPRDLNTYFQLLHSININTHFRINNIPAPAVYFSTENSLTCVLWYMMTNLRIVKEALSCGPLWHIASSLLD